MEVTNLDKQQYQANDNISGWNHINNFNASQNYDHANAAQSPDHGNTKVEDKGAYDFAYHNSKDSKYHNNWILIDGDDITNDHKYANFYYVCFDYESFADDIHSISPKIRLVLQFVAMIVMLYETHVFNLTLQSLLLLSVVCVGIVNIFNFMDGINGMTGGCSLVVLLALMGVNLFFLEFIDNHLLVYMLLADIVFCFFNFRKHAKCFAGDVGSLSLGMIVVFLLLKLMFADGHMHWITFVSVYLVDGGLTILHRLMLKENILTPHKKHAYQIMANELKMPHLAVSGLYMTLQALCCIWFIVSPSNTTLVLQFVLLVAIYLVFMQKCYRLHEEKR